MELMDKISSLVGRYSFRARVFFNGVFCDSNAFAENKSAGQLHLVRNGPVVFRHEGAPALRIDQPAMVFYPRGTAHSLEVPDGASGLAPPSSKQMWAHSRVALVPSGTSSTWAVPRG
jgi:hypothetical protein